MRPARVHRLRLTAAHDDDVRRGAILVGDALRVATLPEARSARHYVVERLDLGAFARDAAPQTLALAIEQRLAELTARAVRADAPGAAEAPAVWFDDESAAIAALAVRVIAGPPPVEWFWRRLAGGALARGTADEVVAACLDAAAAHAAGPAALALVVDRVERARPGRLLGALTPARAEALLARAFGARIPSVAPAPARDAIAAISRLAPAWRTRIGGWVPRWGGDARAVWLVAVALVGAGAAPTAPAQVVARAQAVAAVVVAAATAPSPPAAAAAGPPAPAAAVSAEAGASTPAPREAVPLDAAPRDDDDAPAHRPAPAAAPLRTAAAAAIARARELAAPARTTDDAPTGVAGLLFLLRPLAALDLPGWIDRHPWAAASAFAARLLAGIAIAHGAADDDPLVAALTSIDAAADPSLDRPAWRLAWERAAARWLRAAQLTVGEVVRRPGRATCTRTHLDVRLPARTAELAIRLAGLDLDPGWVPWLGRVIYFHYVDDLAGADDTVEDGAAP